MDQKAPIYCGGARRKIGGKGSGCQKNCAGVSWNFFRCCDPKSVEPQIRLKIWGNLGKICASIHRRIASEGGGQRGKSPLLAAQKYIITKIATSPFFMYLPRIILGKHAAAISGVAGRGGPGVRTPPELPSGVHAKRKSPVRIFFVRGRGGRGLGSHWWRTRPDPSWTFKPGYAAGGDSGGQESPPKKRVPPLIQIPGYAYTSI